MYFRCPKCGSPYLTSKLIGFINNEEAGEIILNYTGICPVCENDACWDEVYIYSHSVNARADC